MSRGSFRGGLINQLQALLPIDIPDDITEAILLISQWLNNINEAGEAPFTGQDFFEAFTALATLEASMGLAAVPPRYNRIITNLEELHYFGAYALSESHFTTGSTFTIRRVYRLPFDAPDVIRLDGFTSGGLDFVFKSMERISNDGISRREHSIIVERQSNTSDPAEIRSRLSDFIHHQSDGYEGVLFLTEDSITTTAMEARWERFYQEEVRIYQNLIFGDTSSFAVFFIQDDIGFTITNIDWRPQSGQSDRPGNIPHTPRDTQPLYTAHITYTGWYSQLTIPGFITRAVYTGEVFNFEHFPSVLYMVSFTAPIDSYVHFVDEYEYNYAQKSEGLYVAYMTSETHIAENEENQDQPAGIAIHPLAIWVLIFGVIAILLFLAVRFRLLRFNGLKSIFKKDEDDQPEEFTENDSDRFRF